MYDMYPVLYCLFQNYKDTTYPSLQNFFSLNKHDHHSISTYTFPLHMQNHSLLSIMHDLNSPPDTFDTITTASSNVLVV